jgi:hypothetical protein
VNTENPHQRDSGRTAHTPRVTAPLTPKEVAEAYGAGDRYSPILTLQQAAELAHLAPGTLKRKVSEGYFKGAVSRGKPLLFWRDRFILKLWNKS